MSARATHLVRAGEDWPACHLTLKKVAMWSDDPKNVTCARCRRVIQRENPTPGVTLSAPMRDMLRYLGVFRIVSPGEFIPSTLAAVERRKFVERVTVDGALYVRLTDAGRAALK